MYAQKLKIATLKHCSNTLWQSIWPTGAHNSVGCVSTGSVSPPLHPPHFFPSTHPPLICVTHDIAGCVQNASQNQPIQPAAIYTRILKYLKFKKPSRD